jgi:hypothetical protein
MKNDNHFVNEHVLDKETFDRLIHEKIERARQQLLAKKEVDNKMQCVIEYHID